MRPENQGSTIVAIYIGAITDRNLASNFYAGKDNLVFSLRTDSASTICVHPFWSATESGFLAMPGREAISGEPLPPAGLVAGGKFDAALDLPPGIVFFAPVLRGLTSVLRNGAMVVLSGALQLLISPAVHSAEHERSGAIPIFQHGAGRRAAVIVAVTDGATGRALEGAVRDVESLPPLLSEYCGFPSERVIVLRDADATEASVLSALRCLRAQYREPDDVLYVHFSCHGVLDGNELRLLMRDSSNAGGITARQLAEAFAGWPGRVIFIADACHGGALEKIAWGISQRPWIIASALADQFAKEHRDLGSLFTHHWKEALCGAADSNGDGLVSLAEAFNYTREVVSYSVPQTPVLLPNREADRLPLAGVIARSTGYPGQPGTLTFHIAEPGEHEAVVDGVHVAVIRGTRWRGWFTAGPHQIALRLLPEGCSAPVLWSRDINVLPGTASTADIEVSIRMATLRVLDPRGPFTKIMRVPDWESVQFVPDEAESGELSITVPSVEAAPWYGILFQAEAPVLLGKLLGSANGVRFRLLVSAEKAQRGLIIKSGMPLTACVKGPSMTIDLNAGEEKFVDLPLDSTLASSELSLGFGVYLPTNPQAGVYHFKLSNAHFMIP